MYKLRVLKQGAEEFVSSRNVSVSY